MTNPFRNRIMADPWQSDGIDIPEIHSNAFRLCCEAIDTVRSQGHSSSVLLYGETGSGKTHVLHRLREYSLSQPNLHIFGSVRLHTSPNRLWRHLRSSFVESLARTGKNNRTQLELIFLRRLFLLCKKKTITNPEFKHLVHIIQSESRLSPNLCQALLHLICQRHRQVVLDWLKGHSLPESGYSALDIRPPDDTDDPEDVSREMVLELCRLAGATIPVILSFDQIEALQRYPNDIEGIFRFGQAIRTLHDETSNMLLVICIQSSFLGELKAAVAVPDFDAMSCRKTSVVLLTRDEALKVISSRINTLPDNGSDHHDLLQILSKEMTDFVDKNGKTCRAILSRCAEILDNPTETGSSADFKKPEPDPPLDTFLQNELNTREESAYSRPIDPEETDDLLQGVLPSLFHIWDDRCREKDGKLYPDVDMVITCPDADIGISLCNHQSINSLAGKLRRLTQNVPPEKNMRQVLIRHPRLRIPAGAKKVNQYLQQLNDRRVRLISPSREALAALQALRSLLSDARSGDLIHQGKPVHEKTVRNWFKSLKTGPAKTFMEDVLSEKDPLSPEVRKMHLHLLELLEKERIIALTEAAGRMSVDTARLEAFIQTHTPEIGYLEGPPAVLFDIVP
jgi:hypothetical protein